RFGSELVLDGFKSDRENLQRAVPIHGLQFAAGGSEQWSDSAVRRCQGRQCFPAFRARHAEVDWVVRGCAGVDGLAVFEVDVQRAARRAEAADSRGCRIGLQPGWDASKTERSRLEDEVSRQWSVPFAQQ